MKPVYVTQDLMGLGALSADLVTARRPIMPKEGRIFKFLEIRLERQKTCNTSFFSKNFIVAHRELKTIDDFITLLKKICRGAVNSRLTLSGLSFCMITIGLLCVTARFVSFF